MQRIVSLPRAAALAGASIFAVSVVAFGAGFPVFSNLRHPVALLGASGVPRAAAFNALGFVLPGLLAAVAMYARRDRLRERPLAARAGVAACAVSGVAFAALGLLPLDSRDLDGAASRAHGLAWTVWWLAFAAGAALLLAGMRRTPRPAFARAAAACAALVLLFALVLPGLVPVGLSQRVAFGAWLLGVVAIAPSRGAA